MPAKKNKEKEVNRLLVENFASLQKAFTNLAVKMDGLSDNINKLLQLFEISAKSFVEKQKSLPSQDHMERAKELRDREFIEKIDRVLAENKTIAKGITLMEEKIRDNLSKEKQILRNIDQEVEEISDSARRLPRI
jgi:hypothetical protein